MDFTSFNAGGIDYSPNPIVTRHSLVLDEPELRQADELQFVRFWDVWHKNRHLYAPKLVELTLVLRPGMRDGKMELTGINAFLDFYRLHIEPLCNTHGLHVYLDCYTAIIGYTRYQVLQEPILLFTIAQPQVYAGDAWPILPAAAFASPTHA
jgi:hypothetical protein